MNNWKFYIGKTFTEIEEFILRLKLGFVTKNYPYGRNWILDLKKILKSDVKVIIDAGANQGSVSKDLSFWFPGAKIYSFEPILSTFQLFEQNCAKNPNIVGIQKALGSRNEKLKIELSSENTVNSIKQETTASGIFEEIEVIPLKNYLDDQGITQIDILKIDVEGYEFEVLQGCENLKIDAIFLEVGFTKEPTKVYFTDVDLYMTNKGYKLSGIYELMRSFEDKRTMAYSNFLYLRNDILK